MDIDPAPVLAPSEAVYVTLQAQLPDRELLMAVLKAALLASERCGEIRLSVEQRPATETGEQHPAVMVVPAGKAADWPDASPESRLRVTEPREVGEVVSEWLRQESRDPWALAAEKVQIGLAIRGAATVKRRPYSGHRTYVLSDPVRAQAKGDAQPIMDLMQACKGERPQVWEMLDTAIVQGIETRSGGEKGFPDPWDLEAEADRTRVFGPVSYAPAWLGVGLGGCIAVVDGIVAWVSDQIDLAGIFVAFTVALVALAAIPWPPLRQALAQVGRRMNAGARMGMPAKLPTYGDRIARWLLIVPLLVLFLFIFHQILGWLFWPAALVGIFIGVTWLLRRISGVLISERVTQPRTMVPRAPRLAQAATTDPQTANRSSVSKAGELELRFISADQVPPASPVAKTRLRLIDERPRCLRRIYAEAVLQLVLAYVVIVSVASALLSTDPFPSGNVIAIWIAAAFSLAVAGWVIYSSRGVPWQKWAAVCVTLWLLCVTKQIRLREWLDLFKGGEGTPDGKPRLRFLFIIGLGWLALTLLTAPAYAQAAVSVTLLLFACAIAYVVVLPWRLGRLEQEYPLSPPFRLLALRVFGSPFLTDFMALTAKWRWLGTTQRLDGPDTAGDRSGDVLAMLRGRLDTRIVEDDTELEQALAHFAEKPDSQLRYALNSVQCTDATWRAALDRLLAPADIIVMDLSGFSQERLGCKYELGKLIGTQALDRVLLLIDESTDRVLLESVLKEAWHAACEENSIRPMPHRVTLIETGGIAGRGPQESEYAWKKRLAGRLEGDLLVALMVDKALAGRNAGARADVAAGVHWTRASSHPVLNLLTKASLVLIALISLFMSVSHYRTRPSSLDAARISSNQLWMGTKLAGFARPATSGSLGAVGTSHRRHAC